MDILAECRSWFATRPPTPAACRRIHHHIPAIMKEPNSNVVGVLSTFHPAAALVGRVVWPITIGYVVIAKSLEYDVPDLTSVGYQ